MARLRRIEEKGPVKVDPQGHSVWICRCGLSQNGPYCDGSHVQARREEESRLYVYDDVTQQPTLDVADTPRIEDLVRGSTQDRRERAQ